MHAKVIVTLVLGKRYQEYFNSYCHADWRSYADKHGYDLIVIDTPVDVSERALKRSPAWQKCLILEHPEVRKYRRVVWVDSDILINSRSSPCICEGVPEEKVGAVDAYGTPTPELHRTILQRRYDFWRATGVPFIDNLLPEQYYSAYGFPHGFDKVVQTGVMVLTPECHQPLFRKVYDEYEEKGGGEWNYEMRPLSFELLKADMVHWLDVRFNMLWSFDKWYYYPFLFDALSLFEGHDNRWVEKFCRRFYYPFFQNKLLRTCSTTSFRNSYFLHFAGCSNEMGLVDPEGSIIRDPLKS